MAITFVPIIPGDPGIELSQERAIALIDGMIRQYEEYHQRRVVVKQMRVQENGTTIEIDFAFAEDAPPTQGSRDTATRLPRCGILDGASRGS